MEKHLHIISFNVPYPADFGGMFDLLYKLPALKNEGVKIHYHCFEYNRPKQPILLDYCESVHYYRRGNLFKNIFSLLPNIVATRRNEELFQRLLKDDHPILMEGIHCTALLLDNRFSNRKCFVRLHNVEYEYYRHLSQSASSILKKIYYLRESRLLEKYERSIIQKPAAYWAVTEKDAATYRKELNCNNIHYLPVFLPTEWQTSHRDTIADHCLYHGDLSVGTNEKMALWLLENVFKHLPYSFIIAGKNPSSKLTSVVQSISNATLVANPSENEMQSLIAKARINVLTSFSDAGIKLKLLNALFNGGHCVVNDMAVNGTGLEEFCHINNSATDMMNAIVALYTTHFDEIEFDQRKKLLNTIFNNENNAREIIKEI